MHRKRVSFGLEAVDHRKRAQLGSGILAFPASLDGIDQILHFHRIAVVETYPLAQREHIV